MRSSFRPFTVRFFRLKMDSNLVAFAFDLVEVLEDKILYLEGENFIEAYLEPGIVLRRSERVVGGFIKSEVKLVCW